jgi:predicted metal-dependent enzyme (double-stranded beta helix superfamily)
MLYRRSHPLLRSAPENEPHYGCRADRFRPGGGFAGQLALQSHRSPAACLLVPEAGSPRMVGPRRVTDFVAKAPTLDSNWRAVVLAQAEKRLTSTGRIEKSPFCVLIDTLHAIKLKLAALASKKDLFPMVDSKMPVAQGRNHPLLVEENDGHGLYLTINMPGKEAAPHDHGIWCVNAAISGRERHKFFRRTDDTIKPGHATVVKVGEVMVEPGNGMAMADHDIHSTEVVGGEPAIGLALYGYALARFPAVVGYPEAFSSAPASPHRPDFLFMASTSIQVFAGLRRVWVTLIWPGSPDDWS